MEIEPKQVVRVIIDLCCLAVVSIPVLVFWVAGEPFHRGFYCDDESLMFPYKKETIPTWLASTVGILLPTALIIITEGIRLKVFKTDCPSNVTFQPYLLILYRGIGSFWFGAAVTQLTTDIAKYSLGRLRPHFLAVCKPNITCASSLGYIETDVCTGTDTEAIRHARLSFPSGHSSFTMYAFVFLMIYLQIRLKWRKSWLLRPFIQLILFYMTFYTCLSRIFDYWHHWSDVLGGALIGIAIALITVFFISDLITDSKLRKGSSSNRLCEGLPLYKSTRQDDDRISVQTSTESNSSGPTNHSTIESNHH